MAAKRLRRRPAEVGDPNSTVAPPVDPGLAAESAPITGQQLEDDDLAEAILRFLRRFPNRTVDLMPLAEELGVDPVRVQLMVERLHWRGMLVAPFIEPSPAGGGTLAEKGLRWLLAREGGRPRDVPVLLQRAEGHVRAPDEAARLPRSQVYGVRRD